jgi:hypothetical protein
MTAGGHGTMQIHNHGASQTIMAFSNWGSNTTGNAEMGIGNNPAPVSGGVDWTHAANGPSYASKKLYVLLRDAPPSGPAAVFHAEPGTRIADAGSNVTFTVSVAGSGPYTYQWRHNGENIAGANKPWLDVASIDGADSGTYDVIVTGPGLVSTTSPAGTLIVTGLPLAATSITYNAGGSASIVFRGDPGRTYRVQRSETLLGEWEDLGPVTAQASGDMPFTDEEAPVPHGFYRAVPVE